MARYLVTGGAGFIGSHLAERLVGQGHEVVVLDDLSTGRVENVLSLTGGRGFRLIVGCATDAALVERLVKECDVVFHLASAVGVDLILERPLPSLRSNLLSTMCVLDAAARYGRQILLASSSEVYGYRAVVPCPEEATRDMGDARDLRSSYASAKAVGENLAIAHAHEHGLPVAIVRFFNTTGPRQRAEQGVLPRFVQAALDGRPLRVLGDGRQTRCFAHVLDVVAALQAVSDLPGGPAAVFNIGTQDEIDVLGLAERIKQATGATVPIELTGYADGFNEPLRRVPDTTKLMRATGWRPLRDLDTIVADVVGELASRGTSGLAA